jgi:hypothetical protein
MTKQMNFLFTTWEGGGNVTPRSRPRVSWRLAGTVFAS